MDTLMNCACYVLLIALKTDYLIIAEHVPRYSFSECRSQRRMELHRRFMAGESVYVTCTPEGKIL